jgi:CRP/FNR family cyclic AMP-dependent transcriptional regulator
MIDKLRKLDFFRAFDENDLKYLAPHVKAETHQAEDILFREGEDGDCMYIIKKGRVDIVKRNKTLSMFTDGDVFGEMALFENSPRSADAITRSKCSLYKILNQDFRAFVFDHPKPGIRFLYERVQEMSQRLRNTSDYLTTVFETGKIIGETYSLKDMCDRIMQRLVEDIKESTGGLIMIMNPFTDAYDLASQIHSSLTDLERTAELLASMDTGSGTLATNDRQLLFTSIQDEKDTVLGYIILESNDRASVFTIQDEVILSAVGNQVGMGILRAYAKQEEDARKRLEQSRMNAERWSL